MQGLSFSSLKKHPSLIPIYVCVFAGLVGSVGYLVRLATKSPEVTWLPKKNTEPWEAYKERNYKLYATPEYEQQIKSFKPPSY
ncbi:cytochrome c oxidase subunit NDUFA4 [Chelonus insularis]|uniref:cytochrome c oxidase subunit NDUFA4 n=1 Tax=Chelonus insularis TaxID=460826 RepID=UPI00158B9720|nr:cytochrome c oxidase subunit NDUFA4 [Chelonus insularis]XP_034944327.1 cytochrome c oxidase subunit NDUFA4 [Chelonus insularis]